MGLRNVVITVTSAADGTATATASHNIQGWLVQIDYVKVDFADGVDVTFNFLNSLLTDAFLVMTNLNAAAIITPRNFTTNRSGTTATSGESMAMIVSGRPSVTVAQAGDTKSGTFVFWFSD